MAKKKRGKNKPSLVNLEASLKKLQSVIMTPEWSGYVQSGGLRGVREKLLKINFETIRNVVDRIPLVNAIINTRIDQITQFCKYAWEKHDKGFKFMKSDRSVIKDSEYDQIEFLENFMLQTGAQYNPDREDDFSDYISMLVRETLVVDQIATELQRNRKGETAAFWLLDATTIKRVDPSKGAFPKTVRFIQEIEHKVYNQYTQEDIIFDYKNKRVDLKFRGFGYSYVEQCIDLITVLLFGYNYVRDQLVRDKIPKGFISVMGDVGKEQLDSIRRYWYAAMSGAGGQWNIPILPSGKEGVGMDFKTLGQSNRDMEYHKLMMFVSSVVAAVFGIDLAELGIKADDSTALIGETAEPRIQASKDRGLASMLAFIEQHVNKILRKVTTDWRFMFVGLEKEDEKTKAELDQTLLKTRKTINELREEAGDEPLEDDYANVVLNEQAVQIYQASQMQGGGEELGEGMEEGPEAGAEIGAEAAPGGAGPEEGEVENIDWESVFAKSVADGEKVIRVVIQ